MFLYAAVAIILCFALLLVLYYNSFVTRNNHVMQAFSTIDVMLKKRCDLTPNLVASVERYMRHESSTLTRIAELRAKAGDGRASPDARVGAGNELGRLLGGLMLQVENYPQLKADTNFLQLGKTMHSLEEQLSAARRTYNAAVTSFNNSVELFPGNLAARLFGYGRRNLLEIPAEDRKVPDVKALFER
ncbi:MAG: LemA family protein [Planctomycetes bacterium]|nr:LemA family protein [Planctomycetota bacterium]